MAQKYTRDDGVEIDVYTAEEKQADINAAILAKESEFGKTKAQLESELGEVKKALHERTGEFTKFRKLSDEAVLKLSVAEKTIYDNGVALEEARKKQVESEENAYKAQVKSVLKSKAGTDEKLLEKMEATWSIIGIEAKTAEEIERKAMMVIGAIGTTEPDLIASLGNFGGVVLPPKPKNNDGKNYADTEEGKRGAAELGLTL